MIAISKLPSLFEDTLSKMQNNGPYSAPKGKFYLLGGNIVPLTNKPTPIKIKTDRIGEPIEINVINVSKKPIGVDTRSNKTTTTVVAHSEEFTANVQLSRGTNRIVARVLNREEEIDTLELNATSIVTTWEAFSRVLFTNNTRILNEQKRTIFSNLGTRLIEPFLSFQDLLPDVQSLQILSTRLLSRGLIHTSGSKVGVDDTIKALTLTTPAYRKIKKDTNSLFLALDPLVNAASQFSGKEAHVWIPNVAIVNWVAFLSYVANQPDLYEIISITEDLVTVKSRGKTERHSFNFDDFGTDFLISQAVDECFKSIHVTASTTSMLKINICAASYTFDLVVTDETPIGECRLHLDDSSLTLDSGCTLDADPVDPFSDGWVGLSLTGRFEQDPNDIHGLDTFIQPSPLYSGDLCVYSGFYTQTVSSQRHDIELDIEPDLNDSFVQTAITWTLQSPNGTKWDIKVNPDGTVFTESGSTHDVNNFKVTKPDSSEASFDITNSGVIQVVTPPPGGEDLNDEIYLKALGGTVWDINVTNSNVIQTEKIFPGY